SSPLPTRGMARAAGGKSLLSTVATILSPAPAANTSSVMCGASVMMRMGDAGAAGGAAAGAGTASAAAARMASAAQHRARPTAPASVPGRIGYILSERLIKTFEPGML